MKSALRTPACLTFSAIALAIALCEAAQQPEGSTSPPPALSPKPAPAEKQPEAAGSEGLQKLFPDHDVWLDTKRKAVVVDGEICLREGLLEMFACPRGTKEHESIVAVNGLAQQVHAALLAVGARPGKPVSFDPQYRPATGQIIDVYVLWKDEQGQKHQARAQDWIKNTRTGAALSYDWVFAGSGFWRDPDTGQEHYKANGGELICVSNFSSAMLDLPVESSQANEELLFGAFTDRIPPKGTKVRVVLIPRPEQGSK